MDANSDLVCLGGIFTMSLPFLFNTNLETIPKSKPYLYADKKKVMSWGNRLTKDKFKVFHNIDTVAGMCESCNEETILVAIVTEYYRCTNCGADTRQHVNGSIRYLRLNESDKEWIKNISYVSQNVFLFNTHLISLHFLSLHYFDRKVLTTLLHLQAQS